MVGAKFPLVETWHSFRNLHSGQPILHHKISLQVPGSIRRRSRLCVSMLFQSHCFYNLTTTLSFAEAPAKQLLVTDLSSSPYSWYSQALASWSRSAFSPQDSLYLFMTSCSSTSPPLPLQPLCLPSLRIPTWQTLLPMILQSISLFLDLLL